MKYHLEDPVVKCLTEDRLCNIPLIEYPVEYLSGYPVEYLVEYPTIP